MPLDASITRILDAELSALRERASFFASKRRSDADLYKVLGDTMQLCERALKEGFVDTLRERLCSKPASARNRIYVERNADVYLIVGRLVFEQEKRRDACWRYTATMREAAKRGISGSSLPDWLLENGGINALFRTRKGASRTRKTKTIYLSTSVTFEVGEVLILNLVPQPDGTFEVLS